MEFPDGKNIPLNQGTFFGEMAAVYGQTRSATVRAVSDVEVLVLPTSGARSSACAH